MKSYNENGQEIVGAATYKIIRFRKSGRNSVVRRGLTLAMAQGHCNNPKTKGANWFDGYTKEG